MAWITLYAAGGAITAIAAFAFGCCASVDTGRLRRAMLAFVAGLCWPIVVVGGLELLAIRLVAMVVRMGDRRRVGATVGRVLDDGRLPWRPRAAGT